MELSWEYALRSGLASSHSLQVGVQRIGFTRYLVTHAHRYGRPGTGMPDRVCNYRRSGIYIL
jgi:hypothetical protein